MVATGLMDVLEWMPMASVALFFLSGAAAGAALTYAVSGKVEAPALKPDILESVSLMDRKQSLPAGGLSREGSFTIGALARENSKIPLVASPQLETDVKGLQRTLANLQGTSRALHQLERHHEGLKADLQQYKAAMQESTARRDLGTFKRLEALEEQQAALEKAVRDEPQPPERGTEPSSSPQPEALEGRLEELGELCRGLAARCDGLQGELSQLQSTAQSPSSGAEVLGTAKAEPAVQEAGPEADGAAGAAREAALAQVGERLEVLELLCERMARHVLLSSQARLPSS